MDGHSFFRILITAVSLLISLLTSPFPASAGRQPKWEAGGGVFGVQFPHYLGSNHYYKFTLPIPVAVFRSEIAEVGQGSKLLLWENETVLVDVGFGGRILVESADEDDKKPQGADNPGAEIYQTKNYTRRGMDDLPFTFFWGVRFKWYLSEHLLLEIPYLNGFTVGGGFQHVGNIYDPELSIDLFDRDSDNSLSLSISGLYGDANYSNFYYKVGSEDVIEGRPEYEADPGFVGLTYGVGGFFKVTDQLSITGGYFINDLKDSVVRDSPLVIAKQSRGIAIGVAYYFFQSSESVRTWK